MKLKSYLFYGRLDLFEDKLDLYKKEMVLIVIACKSTRKTGDKSLSRSVTKVQRNLREEYRPTHLN